MATKTITIMEDAYALLKRAQLPSESFSDTIRRTYNKKKGPEAYFGAWDETFANKVELAIEQRRAAEKKKKPLEV
jgi:predicted CopG family antitoxin